MKRKENTNEIPDPIYYTRPASPNDCTGYVPSSPEEEYEMTNLDELMNVQIKPVPSSKEKESDVEKNEKKNY